MHMSIQKELVTAHPEEAGFSKERLHRVLLPDNVIKPGLYLFLGQATDIY